MALVVSTLQNKLKSLVVNSNNFPKSYELAASNFGNAVNDYGSLVTPPTTTAAAGLAAFISAFIASKPKQSLEILADAVEAYCAAIVPGMAPAFVATPPTPIAKTAMVAALNVAGEVAKNGGSADAWSAAASMAIDTYFRTGTAVNSVSGVTVPWA